MAIGPYSNYSDGEIVQIPGPDGSFIGYKFDGDQRAFYAHEASVLATLQHGYTHIGSDPIPDATIASDGLMSKDDKAKLDSIVGTRIGVLGFQGAGFPDDGGWLQGDIILATGSEAISIERVGNIVRFVVDIPTPLSCPCESCAEIYWVRDFADSGQNGYAIRGPQCGSLLPDVHTYGEFKVYLTPSNTIFSNPDSELKPMLNTTPTFIFKRYDDGIAGGSGSEQAELEMVLERISGSYVTKVGWSMTPGASGVAECVWHMGQDDGANKIEFKLMPEAEPGLLGALLYRGHTLTRRPARITALDATNSSTNMYTAQWWDIDNAISPNPSDTFTVINAVNYDSDGIIVPDVVSGSTLEIGRIISVYSFLTVAGTYRHYCHEIAALNPSTLWVTTGVAEFGNVFEYRAEDGSNSGCDNTDDFRNIERSQWGLAGVYDSVVVDGKIMQHQTNVTIDTSLPGLVVSDSGGTFSTPMRPVTIWNRTTSRDNYMELYLARPDQGSSTLLYPPIDILLRAPIDSYEDIYAEIREIQYADGEPDRIIIGGVPFKDIPPTGYIRVISDDNNNFDTIIRYQSKEAFATASIATPNVWDVALLVEVGTGVGIDPGDVIEILHEDYTSPAVRLLFGHADGTDATSSDNLITMQAQVGTLGMCVGYELDVTGGTYTTDNFIRGFKPGYAVSSAYAQTGTAATDAETVISVPTGFRVYDGSVVSNVEWFNVVKVLVVDSQVYIWWNDLPITPSATLSATLPTPVSINSSFFPIEDEITYGKFGVKLWPGAKVRRIVTRMNLEKFTPFSLGVNSN